MKVTENSTVHIKITDRGCGISDVKKAMEPLWTSHPEEERAGLGFAVMESFSDRVTVKSAVGKGTTVTLTKNLSL
jgi:stage II sporulation protein AB (anti-sigma F factor)